EETPTFTQPDKTLIIPSVYELLKPPLGIRCSQDIQIPQPKLFHKRQFDPPLGQRYIQNRDPFLCPNKQGVDFYSLKHAVMRSTPRGEYMLRKVPLPGGHSTTQI